MIVANLKEVIGISVGNTEIKEVWAGDSKVFPTGPEYFYVQHSSTGIIEKLEVTENVNWPSLVTLGYNYGGLYSDWAGKGDYATAIENGQADTLTFTDGKLQDVNYTSYNGDVFNASCKFLRADAYTSIQTPVKDTLYYLCEPKVEYFTTYIELAYTGTSVNLMYLFIPIDSSLYKTPTSFCKNSITQEEGEYTLYIGASGGLRRDGVTVKIKASDLNPSLLRGYVSFTANGLVPEQNAYYECRAQFTTPDGYSFYTPIKYVYSGSMTTDTFIVSDTPIDYYYIYRTSTNIIERYSATLNPTVNFPAIAGNSYGGVFTDYGGKGTVATALANGDPVTFVDDRVWDDGSGYIGESNVSGATQMFNSNNAITTGTTAYTPTVGAIYYVKESPSWILQRYVHFYPTGISSTPSYIIPITGSDGDFSHVNMYFKEETQSEFEVISLSFATSLKVGTVTLKSSTVFSSKGCQNNIGWLAYKDNIKDKIEVGKNYIFYFELVTVDGISIHSPVKYKMMVSGTTRRDYTFEEIPFEPITYDSQVEYIETNSDNCNISIDEYNNRRFEIDAYIPPTSSDGWLVGSMLADGTKMYAFTPCDENGLSSYKLGSATSPTSLKLEGRYTFSNMANVSECVVTNGTDTITFTSDSTNAANYLPIYLLGLNEGGGGRKTIKGIKLYSAKFYSVSTSATLVKDFIPVRKDSRGYLYDKVDGLKLYAPKGDPITVYGNDVVPNE